METRTIKNVRKVKATDDFVYNLNIEKNHNYFIEKTLLHNSANVIEDESALIPDMIHTGVMRMLGGHTKNFLVKIGNPFKRNHFLRSFRNEKYHKFMADYQVGLKEGRLTPDFIDEMKKEAMFDILYECQFPSADLIDTAGYMVLITENELQRATTKMDFTHFGQMRIGVDVAGGGRNYSVIVARSRNFGEIISRDKGDDTMGLVGRVIDLRKRLLTMFPRQVISTTPQIEIYVDKIGLGKGVYDRLCEQVPNVIGVAGGAQPDNQTEFFNKKAENFWRMREWLLSGGKLKDDENWQEFYNIKYKISSDRKIKMMPKETMLKEGIESPDCIDALALSFNSPEVAPAFNEQSMFPGETGLKQFDPYAD